MPICISLNSNRALCISLSLLYPFYFFLKIFEGNNVNDFQKEEWKMHRLECEALSKLDKERRKSVTPSIRLMLRLCLRRKLETERVKY